MNGQSMMMERDHVRTISISKLRHSFWEMVGSGMAAAARKR